MVSYFTPTRHYCNRAKEYLWYKGISDMYYAVNKDIYEAKEMIDKSGSKWVSPVTTINDQVAVVFNQSRLDELLSK